jgi:type II secretory pathway component PulC
MKHRTAIVSTRNKTDIYNNTQFVIFLQASSNNIHRTRVIFKYSQQYWDCSTKNKCKQQDITNMDTTKVD